MPLRTEAPRKTALVRSAIGASGRNDPGPLLDREGLAGHARLADEEVRRLDHEAVGRDQVAGREQDEVAGHDRADRHRLLHAVAHHAARQREALLQFLDRRGRPVFLEEAEQRAAEDDRQDDGGVHPLLEHQRDRGGEGQDEDERAFELAQQQPQRAQARRVLDAVGADAGQAALRLDRT